MAEAMLAKCWIGLASDIAEEVVLEVDVKVPPKRELS